MIELLRIENLAVVERAEISFGPGLNVLTGETGAGKSIVLGALALLAGARASADAVRDGADEAVVEAIFRTDALPELETELARRGLAAGEHELLRAIRTEGDVTLEDLFLRSGEAAFEVGRERVLGRMDGRGGSVRDLLVRSAIEHEIAHGLLDHVANLLLFPIDLQHLQNLPSNFSEASLLSFSCSRILRTYAAFVVIPIVLATSSIGNP